MTDHDFTAAEAESRRRYGHDTFFRIVTDGVVARVLAAHPRVGDDAEMRRVAYEVCVVALELIMTNDAGLNEMRRQRDAYMKLAEDAIALQPMPFFPHKDPT